MKQIASYIFEKLKIDKDIKFNDLIDIMDFIYKTNSVYKEDSDKIHKEINQWKNDIKLEEYDIYALKQHKHLFNKFNIKYITEFIDKKEYEKLLNKYELVEYFNRFGQKNEGLTLSLYNRNNDNIQYNIIGNKYGLAAAANTKDNIDNIISVIILNKNHEGN